MNKLFDYIKTLQNALAQHIGPTHNAQQEAWWLLEKITGKKKSDLLTSEDFSLTKQQENKLNKLVMQRCKDHKPLQYILGSVPFCNLDIIVRPPILIPRPETEEWCTWLIDKIKKLEPRVKDSLRILDLCCGSGAIGLALAKAFPRASVIGSDINDKALDLSCENKQHNGITNIDFVHSDLFENLSGHFDIIVSNPPYISQQEWKSLQPEVREWEDVDALVADDEGLAIYKKLIAQAPIYLEKNPHFVSKRVPQIILEIGSGQGENVSALLKKNGFSTIHIGKDGAGKDRFGYANL